MNSMKRIFALALLIAAPACARSNDDAVAHAAEDVAGNTADVGTAAGRVVYRVPLDDAPALGDARAPVTVVAFTDYECPFCVRAEAIVGQLRRAYGAKVRLVMRQLPLAIHPHARAAATAAVAAGKQGKFWQMHERLFASSRSLDEETIARLASELDLDLDRFAADRGRAAAEVDRDHALATSLGVQGTPSFFVNGRNIAGAQPIDTWRPVIDQEIAKAQALVDKGTRPEDVYVALTRGGLERAAQPSKLAAPGAAAVPPKPGAPVAAAAPCEGACDCDEPSGDKGAEEVIEQVDATNAPARGEAGAPVTIVAFSDFQCPFALRSETTLRALLDEHSGRVRIAWKNLPLPMHASARDAARASLAAGQQGKFWEYHDALFAHQDALDADSLERYARDLGLDVDRFRAALKDPAIDAAIAADEAEAHRLGVSGTPTFFVNGRRLAGAQPKAAFEPLIERASADRPR